MTKRHFESIAAIIAYEHRLARGAARPEGLTENIAHKLADYFANENPRFDRQRFLVACGVLIKPVTTMEAAK